MSLASNAGVKSFQKRRPLAVMGDGGFWHNGLLSGVTSRSAQWRRRRPGHHEERLHVGNRHAGSDLLARQCNQRYRAAGDSATAGDRTIENALKGLGVEWLKTVHTYRVSEMRKTLIDAFKSPFNGLKVIVAEGECQLERQRRLRPIRAKALAAGKRTDPHTVRHRRRDLHR